MAQYARVQDLHNLGLPDESLEEIKEPIKIDHLVKASARINLYLRGRYKLSSTGELAGTLEPNTFPDEIVHCCCVIARYWLLIRRGFNPENDADAEAKASYEDCLAMLEMIRDGELNLDENADADSEFQGGPKVNARVARGWYETNTDRDDRVP